MIIGLKVRKIFFNYVHGDIKEDLLNKAAFHLHQAAESAYKAILLVFTNYSPAEHMLELLEDDVKKAITSFTNIFPQETKEEEERFELLEYAYIGGRYDPEFYISKEDLEILAKDVQNLLVITEKICTDKIESLRK